MFYNNYSQKDVIFINKKVNNITLIEEQSNILENDTQNIKNMIYTIRGKQVMIDSDVAMLYHYTTKRINETVRRNRERFPSNFCFQLYENEVHNLRSQSATSSLKKENYGGRRYIPYAFTEQGIAMLSGLLRNEIAIKVSINIINAFVEMRKFIANNAQIFKEMNTIKGKLLEYDKKFDIVFDELQKKKEREFNERIFYNGQIFDSYSLIIKIIKSANNKILIIDNYIDNTILDMLSKKNKNVQVILLTSQNCDLTKLDIEKFNKQYPLLKITKTNKFHDRFMVIDEKELFHLGASLKDLGKKCFAISKMEDIEFIKNTKNIVF